MSENLSGRGGSREGAGRPPLTPELRRVPVQITLPPEYAEKLRALAKIRLTTIGRLVEDWLDSVEMPAARRYNGILTSGILDMGRKEQS